MKKLSQRMERINPQFFATLDTKITEMQRDGIDVIRLDVGSPDIPPASNIIQALSRSAHLPTTHGYTSHRGISELRQAWSTMYDRVYKVNIDPELQVLPLLGSKEGIFHITQALIGPGDVVLVPDPGYLTYTMAAKFAGGQVYKMPLLAGNDYLPDLDAIPAKVKNRSKLMWLNYPNNPTSATVEENFFKEVVKFSEKSGILVCHDAAYSQVTYDSYHAPSLLGTENGDECCLEFNTLSKSHNMAGWRVGAALGSAAAIIALYRVITQVDSGHFLPIMEAATEAMTGDQVWLRERNLIYQQRRDYLVGSLTKLGFVVSQPKASLYIWCPVPRGTQSSVFTAQVLEQAHVSLTPGTVFGEYGEGFVRISLTSPIERISQAMERLSKWMGQ